VFHETARWARSAAVAAEPLTELFAGRLERAYGIKRF
jgi:hypothetical protein